MPKDEIEGRINAHRDALVMLFALLAEDAQTRTRSFLFDWLDERSRMNDHQEDPGAVIQEGFAEQQARASEFRIIADDVRALVAMNARSHGSAAG